MQKVLTAIGYWRLNLSAEDEIIPDIGMWNTVSCLDQLLSKKLEGNFSYLGLNPALSHFAAWYFYSASTLLVT